MNDRNGEKSRVAGHGRYGKLYITAIMHSAQLCAVMLGDSDRSPMGIGFVPFGAAIFWT